MLLCAGAHAGLRRFTIWRAHRAAYDALTKLRQRIVEHLQGLPLGFFQSRKSGELVNIMHHDVEQIEAYLAHGLPEILSATLFPGCSFLAVLALDWRLGLALVSTMPLSLLMQLLVRKYWGRVFKQYGDSTQRMSEGLLEYVATIPVVKAFSREETRTERLLDDMQGYLHWVRRMMYTLTGPMSLIGLFLEAGIVALIVVGLWLLGTGELSPVRFILSLILGSLFTASFAKLSTLHHFGIVYQQSLARVQSITDQPRRAEPSSPTPPDRLDVELEGVTFTYPGKEAPALEGVTLSFPAGSRTGVVGASGCGKSTLSMLMMGFWDADRGTVRLGGRALSRYREEDLAHLFALVQQEVFLFNVSLADNIRMGRPEASRREIEAAARRAMIHDFIAGLPEGYDTIAGEVGAKLSGGEKQRISIARMLLKDAPIVILDEATAALDGENERLIGQALEELQRGRTVVTIAHRLSTVRRMERIVVMDAGRVVGLGSHEELLATCPLYAEMHRAQEEVSQWQLKQ
ncbi:MAG: ABC transporter ATP-binding protein [Bacteroidia bacterium]|nr:MAG: ABC transporter ATP-binding protein [Bacteroidia bacterium]